MTAKPSLAQLAADLRQVALDSPGQPTRQQLSGGLWLTLIHRLPGRWQLSLSRPGVVPSYKEVEICRAVFAAPEAGRHEQASQLVGRETWHTVRLIWTEAAQLSLVEAGATPPGDHYQD